MTSELPFVSLLPVLDVESRELLTFGMVVRRRRKKRLIVDSKVQWCYNKYIDDF
jgi:hypothetical protein